MRDLVPRRVTPIAVLIFLVSISLGLNNIVIGYKVLGVSIDRIFQLVAVALVFPELLKDLKKNQMLRVTACFIAVLVVLNVLASVSVLLRGELLDSSGVARQISRSVMYGVYFYLAYFCYTRMPESIYVVVTVFLCAFLMAFFQSPFTPLTEVSQQLKLSLFANNLSSIDYEIFSNFLANSVDRNMRVTGPYGQTVTLSYALVSMAILCCYLWLRNSSVRYLYIVLFLFVVSVMTLTRSSVLAISLILMFMLARLKAHAVVLFFVGLAFVLTNLELLAGLSTFERVLQSDISSSGKVFLAGTGIATLLQYPLGVTGAEYESVKAWMFSLHGHPHILRFTPHNGLINLGFEYTVLIYPALAIWLFALIKRGTNLTSRYRAFWILAAVAYLIQQSFHNNGIFYSEFTVLLLIAVYVRSCDEDTKRTPV